MRTNEQQDIEQVAGIITARAQVTGAIDPEEERRINETSGWGYEVRYDDHEYLDTRSCTRVAGRQLSPAALDQALALAAEWAAQ